MCLRLRKSYLSQSQQLPPGNSNGQYQQRKQNDLYCRHTAAESRGRERQQEKNIHTHTHTLTHVTAEVNEGWGARRSRRDRQIQAEETLETPILIDRERGERQKAGWTDRGLTAESFFAVSGY